MLGPIEFCIYTILLGAILNHYKINYHIYADDAQIYCSFEIDSLDEVLNSISDCISDIRSWMITNKLKINDDKTEFLLTTSPHKTITKPIQISIGQEVILPSSSCKSLGVMFDKHLEMNIQVKSICKSTHFHIRNIREIRHLLPSSSAAQLGNIREIRHLLPSSSAAQLVHSLVTSRLDYCNALLHRLPDCRIKPLQRVQNIAARVVSLCSRQDDIEDILKSLHWLPVKQRILFKVLLLVYKCKNDLVPEYLRCLCKPYKQDYNSRSNKLDLLDRPSTKKKSYGDRAFSVAGPEEWNRLPLDLKLSPSLETFKSKLKTHLYQQCFL